MTDWSMHACIQLSYQANSNMSHALHANSVSRLLQYRSFATLQIRVYLSLPLILTATLRLFRGRIHEEEREPSEAADVEPAAEMVAGATAASR